MILYFIENEEHKNTIQMMGEHIEQLQTGIKQDIEKSEKYIILEALPSTVKLKSCHTHCR